MLIVAVYIAEYTDGAPSRLYIKQESPTNRTINSHNLLSIAALYAFVTRGERELPFFSGARPEKNEHFSIPMSTSERERDERDESTPRSGRKMENLPFFGCCANESETKANNFFLYILDCLNGSRNSSWGGAHTSSDLGLQQSRVSGFMTRAQPLNDPVVASDPLTSLVGRSLSSEVKPKN